MRSYNWRIVSYCTEEEIRIFCEKQASKWEYILHDKDKDEKGEIKEKHYHINVTLKIWKSREQVCKLVGESGNNFAIEMTDKLKAHRYLTHKDNPEKYQYDDDEIKSNFKWKDGESKEEIEEFIKIVADKKIGMREKAIRYGKDFMRNYKRYKEYVELMELEEAEKERVGVRYIIEFIKDKSTNSNWTLKQILTRAIEIIEERNNLIEETENNESPFEETRTNNTNKQNAEPKTGTQLKIT